MQRQETLVSALLEKAAYRYNASLMNFGDDFWQPLLEENSKVRQRGQEDMRTAAKSRSAPRSGCASTS